METVTLTQAQLDLIVAAAVSAAVAAVKPKRQPKAEKATEAPTAEQSAKIERAAAYLQAKKDVALKLLREKGIHYGVYQKGRKLLVWSDLTHDKARREGRPESIGKRIWSTVEVESLGGQKMGTVTA